MHVPEQHSMFPMPPLSQKLPAGHWAPIPQDGGPHIILPFMAVIQFRDSQSESAQQAPPPEGDTTQTPPVQLPVQHCGPAVQEEPAGQLVCWQTLSMQQPLLHGLPSSQPVFPSIPTSAPASMPVSGNASWTSLEASVIGESTACESSGVVWPSNAASFDAVAS
jgi:hypothetical protein